jgi:hypothetical protein
MTTELLLMQRAPLTAQHMAEAAAALVESLEGVQRTQASFAFSGDERYCWAYTPGPRNGLQLKVWPTISVSTRCMDVPRSA